MRALTLALIAVALTATAASAQEPPPASAQEQPSASAPESPYVGAAACKTCHEDTHDAWSKTKHATAISRLSAGEKSGGQCIQCHVTGSPEMIAAQKESPSHPGVQCESCHGPGRGHVEARKAGDTTKFRLVKSPDEKSCTSCHNSTSPHFRGFFFKAMAPMVHKTK